MTTPMRIAPWTTVDRFGVDAEEGQVGPDEGEDEDRHDRAGDAAAPAGQADPAEDDRRDALAACRTRAPASRCRWSR